MDKVIGRLTVFFEDPFWVGVFERIENGRLSAAKVTFGAEPKEPELLIYLRGTTTDCNSVRLLRLP